MNTRSQLRYGVLPYLALWYAGSFGSTVAAQAFDVLDIDIVPQRSSSTFTFPYFPPNTELTATLDVINGVDPFDRAANFYIEKENGDRIELLKLITGFGGTSTHTRDITHLLPLLSGRTVKIGGYVDAFVGNAWHLDGSISATTENSANTSVFARSVIPETQEFSGFFNETLSDGTLGRSFQVEVPDLPNGINEYESLTLYYFTSGHSFSDGTGANEFVTAQHRIFANGIEVDNYTADNNQAVDGYVDELGLSFGTGPGTFNVENFRIDNPNVTTGYQNTIASSVLDNPDTSGDPNNRVFTTREVYFPWRQFGTEYAGNNQGGGTFQFARSGWKPGDSVQAATIDVKSLLQEGENTITLSIGDGEYSNDWRFSAYLVGELATEDLLYTGSPIDDPADVNQDGQVNRADIDHFIAAWKQELSPLYGFADPADFDLDGIVDVNDAIAFRQAFTQSGLQAALDRELGLAVVPESTCSVLAAVGITLLSMRRDLL